MWGEETVAAGNVTLGTGYVTAFYWAITTLSTVGYGDITPATFGEMVFSILAELFGCVLFAMLIGTLGSMMVGKLPRHFWRLDPVCRSPARRPLRPGEKLLEEKVNRQLAELREFMDVRRIPKELRVRVRHYMELLCTNQQPLSCPSLPLTPCRVCVDRPDADGVRREEGAGAAAGPDITGAPAV